MSAHVRTGARGALAERLRLEREERRTRPVGPAAVGGRRRGVVERRRPQGRR